MVPTPFIRKMRTCKLFANNISKYKRVYEELAWIAAQSCGTHPTSVSTAYELTEVPMETIKKISTAR
jgi:hypothetical protein